MQCAYGIFFFPDAVAGTSALIRLLRPDGRLAVSVWERSATEPVITLLYKSVRPERPELTHPWSHYEGQPYTTADGMTDWLAGLGLERIHTRQVDLFIPLDDQLAWSLILGGGMRAMLLGLTPQQVDGVRTRFLQKLADDDVRTLNATSIIGVGHRP